jgi:hypothetical protein
MGAICAAKEIRRTLENGDHVDLPFDPVTKDILCERREDGCHFNIFQVFRHHSPSGFEWGYPGSGPADFALNILELFARETGEKPTVRLWDGNRVTVTTWRFYQKFKASELLGLPREGGRIRGDDVRRWLVMMKKATAVGI